MDAFPDDERLWSDMDEDGYADQQGTNLSDDCPRSLTPSTEDAAVADTGGDGWSTLPMPT